VCRGYRNDSDVLFWSAASQFEPTQHARLAKRVVSEQMHPTASCAQLPKEVTQLPAHAGRPGMLTLTATLASAARRTGMLVEARIAVVQMAHREDKV